MKRLILHTAACLLLIAAAAQAQDFDRVMLHGGGPGTPGKIAEITRDKVVIAQTNTSKEIPVSDVKYIIFTGEPADMRDARNAAVDGNYDLVIETLDKIPIPQLTSEYLKQDAEYYRALAMSKLAADDAARKAAGGLLIKFINAYPNSYHFYDANEAAGDLLVAMGLFDQAPRFYGELAKAAAPEAKVRAAVAIGRALQAQGKHAEAVAQFDAAMKDAPAGKAAEAHAMAAKVGKARSMVEMNQVPEGISVLKAVIDEAPADNNLLNALAYNALGTAYLKTNQPKEALYAFLHVDVVYNQVPDQHAEALYNLKNLWEQAQKGDRAREAGDLLKARYASSRWAAK